MQTLLRTTDAARALGVRPGTLRKWIRRGAPVVEPGGNGPGQSALVDIAAIEAWRGRKSDDAPLVRLDTSALAKGLLATYRANTHRQLGLTNRQAAAMLVESYWHTVRAATNHPPTEPHPAEMATLIAIALPSR